MMADKATIILLDAANKAASYGRGVDAIRRATDAKAKAKAKTKAGKKATKAKAAPRH